MTELKGTVLDLENKTEKFLAQIGEKMETVQIKVDKMEEGEVLRAYTDERAQNLEDALNKKIATNKVEMDKRIKEIYKNHLLKDGLIGDDEKCSFKSLLEYTTAKIPDLTKRLGKQHENHEKHTELIR